MPPGRNSHSPSTSVPAPFLLVYAALLAVAPLVMGPGRLPLGQGLDFFGYPVPSSPPGATVGPASPIFTPRCPFSCPQLDAFSISLNVPSPRPGLLLGLIRARARCSRVVPVLAVPCSPALPFSGGDGGATYLRGGGFLPSRKCLGASSPPTPLNGYTFTLFRRHPCRHGRPSIHLQTIHVHYCERLVSFPAHDNSSSIQHLGDEGRAEPRELQLHSPCSFQRYVVDPYQLSRLVLSPLVSVSCPNRRLRASTLVAYAIFSRSGSPTKYIRAPAVKDRNRSDDFSSSVHCPRVAYSSN